MKHQSHQTYELWTRFGNEEHCEKTKTWYVQVFSSWCTSDVVKLPLRMGAEDFAHCLQHIPGSFFRLGTRNQKKGITAPVHSPWFDIDEDAVYNGAVAMAWFALAWLRDANNAN